MTMKKNILLTLGTLCFSTVFLMKLVSKMFGKPSRTCQESDNNIEDTTLENVIDFGDFKNFQEEQRKKKSGRPGRKICVYSVKGRFLKSYNSIAEAANKEKIPYFTIIKCASGQHLACRNTTNIFLYEFDNIHERLRKIRENAFQYPHLIEAMKKSGSESGPENLLRYIPSDKDGIFTYKDYLETRKNGGFNQKSANGTLRKWKERGYVEPLGNGKYKKLRKSDIRVLV